MAPPGSGLLKDSAVFGGNQLSCKPLRIPKPYRGFAVGGMGQYLVRCCHRSPDNLVVFLEALEVVQKVKPEIKTDSKSITINILDHDNKAMLQ